MLPGTGIQACFRRVCGVVEAKSEHSSKDKHDNSGGEMAASHYGPIGVAMSG
jgi:hypothetical protein